MRARTPRVLVAALGLGVACTPAAAPPEPAAARWSSVEVIAGSTRRGVVDGVGEGARFNSPGGLGVDGDRVLVGDTFSASVRAVDLESATVTTLIRTPAVTQPRGITGDGGVLYFGDRTCVKRLEPGAEAATVLAGSCVAGGFVDGAAAAARFEYLLHDLELDRTRGALYLSDRLNDAVRAVDLGSGAVWTLAGGAGAGSDDGVGALARFDGPGGLALDEAAGVLYVADTFNSTVRAVDVASGAVTTVAGVADDPGDDDGPVTDARVDEPQGLALVGRTLVFGGFDGAARALDLEAGSVTTLARGLGGTFASLAPVPGARAVLWMDLSDALLRLDLDAAPADVVKPVAGPRAAVGFVDGAGAEARFARPLSLEVTRDGRTAYLSDLDNHAVRVVDLETHAVRTLVGGPTLAGDRDGPLAEARLSSPTGLALDEDGGVLYVAELGNQDLRAIDLAAGLVRTLAGSGARGGDDGAAGDASFAEPWELALGDGALYVADSGGPTVRRVALEDGAVSTVVGRFGESGADDGVGEDARLRVPDGLALLGDVLFVSDWESNTLRRVELSSGATTTLLGTDGFEGAAAGPPDFAAMSGPSGLSLGDDGAHLYVVEEGGDVLREVDLVDGSSRFLVGRPGAYGGLPTGVPTPLAEATLLGPQDVDVAGDSLVVLADGAVWCVRP